MQVLLADSDTGSAQPTLLCMLTMCGQRMRLAAEICTFIWLPYYVFTLFAALHLRHIDMCTHLQVGRCPAARACSS